MQMSNICVITLSDTESDLEPDSHEPEVSVIDLEKTEYNDSVPGIINLHLSEPKLNDSVSKIPVITLDDSISVVDTDQKVSFKIDTLPDYIPIVSEPPRKPNKRKKRKPQRVVTPLMSLDTSPPTKKMKMIKPLMESKEKTNAVKPPTGPTKKANVLKPLMESKKKTNAVKPPTGPKKKVKRPIPLMPPPTVKSTPKPLMDKNTAKKNDCAHVTVRNIRVDENTEVSREFIRGTPNIKLSHSNILSTTANERPCSGLRPVIIDGCNVACGHGNGAFSVEGIIHVIQYFLNRKHEEIVCFLPQSYRGKMRLSEFAKTIHEYERKNIIIYTPSRTLKGKQITPYDDRFIVQYASERQGVIISNDGYRDLFDEDKSWQTTIADRIINFTFARGLLMLPKDPLGRDGPTLDEVLRFP